MYKQIKRFLIMLLKLNVPNERTYNDRLNKNKLFNLWYN